MGTFGATDGRRYKKSEIDARVKRAKAEVLENMRTEFGYVFCQDCTRSSGTRFDCSHEISVNECQNSGRCNLAWDLDNIKIRCRECHRKHDKLY